jgi:hypothetical protein
VSSINRLKSELNAAVATAMAVQRRLSAARQREGLRDRPAIYSAAQVAEMRAEWHRRAATIAKLAVATINSASAPQNPGSTNADLAAQIIAAGKKRRNEE